MYKTQKRTTFMPRYALMWALTPGIDFQITILIHIFFT